MPQIVKRIDVDASREAVWQVLSDFGGVGLWAPAVREAHCTTHCAGGVGCRRVVTASNGSTVEEVVTRWDEGHSFTFEVPGGVAGVVGSLEETWSVEASPDGSTVVVVVMDYHSRLGFVGAAVAKALVDRVLGRMLSENLKGLKGYVESGAASPAPGGTA